MIVFLIKTIFLISCLFSYSYGASRLVCKRGVKKVYLINGKRKVVCVVKKKKVVTRRPPPAPLKWNANWWAKLAARPEGEPFLASNRYRFQGEVEKGVAPWTSIVVGGRATYDLMSAVQGDDYRDDYSQDKRVDWELWNAFVDFSKDSWRLRLGQQQVAWGEAFGFFYADIVNPKDFRERGIGRLADLRLPVTMANLQWTGKNISVQALWVPFFKSNRSPTAKSDYFPQANTALPLPAGVEVATNSTAKLDGSEGNYGGRVSATVVGVDVSVFYYDFLETQPYYLPDTGTLSGNRFLLRPHHARAQSTGLTFSTDIGGTILRSENVYTPERRINTLSNNNLSFEDVAQRVHVLGLDFPKWKKINFGIQGSIDSLDTNEEILFRNKNLTLLTTRIAWDLRLDRLVELLYSMETDDYSSLIQTKYTHPVSASHEIEVGADIFAGPTGTFFGQTNAASRVYLLVKGTL